MSKIRVAVLFGGVSSEHEISLKSAANVIQNLPKDKYEVIPIGITKKGRWLFYPGDVKNIPLGLIVHNVELTLGRGGQLVRSAGVGATVVAKEGDYVTLRLPSGEMRMVFGECMATIGELGNEDHMNVSLGKAGASRHLGRRPKVRGVVMNPIDHPHGGGEGKTAAGRHPVTPWGKPTKGAKTRSKKNPSNAFIVKKRK